MLLHPRRHPTDKWEASCKIIKFSPILVAYSHHKCQPVLLVRRAYDITVNMEVYTFLVCQWAVKVWFTQLIFYCFVLNKTKKNCIYVNFRQFYDICTHNIYGHLKIIKKNDIIRFLDILAKDCVWIARYSNWDQ